jgi:ankyrin repeat protein
LFKAKDGSTVFLVALARGSEPFARLMLDHGADINVRDAAGNTPLHLAVQQGKVELMKELVARGANVNEKTQASGRGGRGGAGAPGGRGGGAGLTPFLEAAQTGNVAMLKELIALGADPKAKGPDGSGGVIMATGSRKLEAVKMMVELGLDVNDGPKGRGSPLHTAVRSGSNDIVQYLADHGADFDAKDNFGRNPLEEALFEAPQPTIELMQKLTAERAAKK